MKSLQTLILSHILVSIFMTFFLVYGYITRPFLIIFLLALPVLNKGQRFQKITSKKIRLLNASINSLKKLSKKNVINRSKKHPPNTSQC